MTPRFRSCVVVLHDGRTLDCSGLTAAEAWARLVAARVTSDDVRDTRIEVASAEQVDAADDLERLAVQ